MGEISNIISEIQERENLTLPELFEKYPHLAKLQYEEHQKEIQKKKKKQLLCD